MPRDTTLTMQASSAVCSPAADNLLREVSQHDFNARMRFFLGIRVRPEQFVSLVRKLDARSRRLQGVILRTHSFDWTLTKVTCGLLLNRKSSPETRLHRVQPRWHGAAVPEWTEETGGVRASGLMRTVLRCGGMICEAMMRPPCAAVCARSC